MWFNSFFPFYVIPSKQNEKKLARYENDIEFQNNFFKRVNRELNTFKWKNLPSSCSSRFLELCYLLDGCATFVNDPEFGLLTLGVTRDAKEINMYGDMSNINAYGYNGFYKSYKAYMEGSDNENVQAVFARDNPTCYPYIQYILATTRRVTNSMRALDVAVKNMKVPYFITCEESQVKAVEKKLSEVDDNLSYIIANKSINRDTFNVFPTHVDPSLISHLWEHLYNLDELDRETMGINGAANQDKKERLIVDEVNANNQATNISLAFRLEERKQTARNVNELWGYDIDVEINEGYGGMTTEKEVDYNGMEELSTLE